jgi:hypothetical protein
MALLPNNTIIHQSISASNIGVYILPQCDEYQAHKDEDSENVGIVFQISEKGKRLRCRRQISLTRLRLHPLSGEVEA